MLTSLLRRSGRVDQHIVKYLRNFHSGIPHLVRVQEIKTQENLLEVKWDNKKSNRYPFVYLRERCRCPSCFHESSRQRLLHMRHLDLDVVPTKTRVGGNGGKVEITWVDHHVSEFDSDWLLLKRLPENSKTKKNENMLDEEIHLWEKDFNIPTFEFHKMLSEEVFLLEWLLAMRRYGVAIVTGVPRKLGQLERLGDAVGFLKNTFYSETVSLRSEFNARSLAYTNYELQPHTDLPYYEFKPSVILLQFIEQVKSSGGVNTLVDGFNILQHFKEERPRDFDLMVSTPVLWQIIGTEKKYGDFKMTFARPVIEIGWTGKISRLNYNEPLREGFIDVPVQNMADVYRAYHSLTNMFYDPRFVVKQKMRAGEMLTMSNDRLLHGRTAFAVKEGDKRWLEQAYVDWDVLRSKTEILNSKLKKNPD